MMLACGFARESLHRLKAPVREGLLEGLRVPQGGLHGTPDSVKWAQTGKICDIVSLVDGPHHRTTSYVALGSNRRQRSRVRRARTGIAVSSPGPCARGG